MMAACFWTTRRGVLHPEIRRTAGLLSCFLSEFLSRPRGRHWKEKVTSIIHAQKELFVPSRCPPIQKLVMEMKPGSWRGRKKNHPGLSPYITIVDPSHFAFPFFIVIIITISIFFPLSFMACYKGFPLEQSKK